MHKTKVKSKNVKRKRKYECFQLLGTNYLNPNRNILLKSESPTPLSCNWGLGIAQLTSKGKPNSNLHFFNNKIKETPFRDLATIFSASIQIVKNEKHK